VIFIQAAYAVSALTMSTKLQEIRRKLAKLEKEADELKRLKSDYQYAKKFRRMLVKQEVD
jgi:hypothetical protein